MPWSPLSPFGPGGPAIVGSAPLIWAVSDAVCICESVTVKVKAWYPTLRLTFSVWVEAIGTPLSCHSYVYGPIPPLVEPVRLNAANPYRAETSDAASPAFADKTAASPSKMDSVLALLLVTYTLCVIGSTATPKFT